MLRYIQASLIRAGTHEKGTQVQQAKHDEAPPLAYSIDSTAKQLGVSRSHVNALIASGELPHRKTGRRVLVPRSALEEFLAGK